MSEEYIKSHFADIKKYVNVVENRLDDEWCTLESVLEDNAHYVLIDDKYEIIIDL